MQGETMRVRSNNELPESAMRALRFLNAATSPKIRAKLSTRGFDEAELAEGWRLLQGATGHTMEVAAPKPAQPTLLDLLDSWENEHFPIISASLKRNFPEIHDAVFLNLSQTEGPALLVTLPTLHERLVGLKKSKDGKAALALLAKRGIDEAVLEALAELIAQATSIKPDVERRAAAEQTSKDARELAIKALDAYLDEWSALARQLITNKTHLRQLGLMSWRGPKVADAAE
jgi:hypothetical protein